MAGRASDAPLSDRLGRPAGVLRLSLTARCNLNCPYCCPDNREPEGLLSDPERVRLVAVAAGLGFSTLRLTGGEPLLHPGLPQLVRDLSALRAVGLREIAMTSNGQRLTRRLARELREAGLDRLTLSLDGTTAASVARMVAPQASPAQGEHCLRAVLAALATARQAGFEPGAGRLKLNAVIVRGRNEDQVVPLAGLARELGVELRLIEAMDVGSRNGWRPDQVMPAAEMVQRIGAAWPLEPLGRPQHGTASRWRYRDGGGLLAVVASISQPFCGDCNRLRITANGMAHTCLFASQGTDLRQPLRQGPEALSRAIAALWGARSDRYSEERSERLRDPATATAHAEMAYLGG
ncbi:radical SAM protein [Synechococcus sp. RSCCF101]|uniref:GTP 3',8-cyclase MoaA n=1 Tax=Synechococcus sp. RSCCF101 TaxID=2511069 RepID=UPI0012442203|nr:radical SAM protein [Synechococcus sp. RSCCF101]QEY32614.1 radical SAM protein [Synechococcus sp. RSCCF101]